MDKDMAKLLEKICANNEEQEKLMLELWKADSRLFLIYLGQYILNLLQTQKVARSIIHKASNNSDQLDQEFLKSVGVKFE